MEILKRYPRTLPGGLTLRPLEPRDGDALLAFFKRIPVDERELFKDDVTDPKVIRQWIQKLDYSHILPLVVVSGSRIAADATLHRDRRGWARHVAKIRVALDPEFRGKGLATTLVKEIIEISKMSGISLLDAEILSRQSRATHLFEKLGFMCTAILPQHAFDLAGHLHDIAIYTFTVTPPEKFMPGASLPTGEVDIGGG